MSRHDDAIGLQHIIVHSREAIDILGGRSSSQGTPAPLRHHLADHSVDTLVEKGWSDKGNGELLDLAGHPCDPPAGDATREMRAKYAGVGWTGGSWLDYDREHCVDLVQLAVFLHATRPEVAESLALAEDGQVAFKGRARAFVRTHAFLFAVLPYCNAAWEKRSLFLEFLIPKLPAPREEDFSKEILDAIDMDSYRVEKQAMQAIALADRHGDRPGAECRRERPSRGGSGPALQHHRASLAVCQ